MVIIVHGCTRSRTAKRAKVPVTLLHISSWQEVTVLHTEHWENFRETWNSSKFSPSKFFRYTVSISSFLQILTMILIPSYVSYLYHLRFLCPWSALSRAQMLGATTRDSALENTVGQPQGSVHNRGNVVTKSTKYHLLNLLVLIQTTFSKAAW